MTKWTTKDMAYRPGGLSQSEQELVAWSRNSSDGQPDLAQVGEVGVWGTALERVIAEQQEKIDWLTGDLKRAQETSETLWTRHNELFEAIARLLDYDLPIDPAEQDWTQFSKLRHAVRMQMLDTGYCLRCYNFVCECDYD